VIRRQQLVEREKLHLDLTTVRAFDTGGGGSVFRIHANLFSAVA
jgi:hypothetical protein